MPTPTLLLQPGASRDRSGAVSPTVPAGVTVVAGAYGDAWSLNGETITAPFASYLGAAGTVISRIQIPAAGDAYHYGFLQINGTSGLTIQRRQTDHMSAWTGGGELFRSGAVPVDAFATTAVVYDATASSGWINGTKVVSGGGGVPSFGATPTINLVSISGVGHLIETHLFFDEALSDSDIEAVMTTDATWTWDILTPSTAPHRSRVFAIGSKYNLGPLPVGKRR